MRSEAWREMIERVGAGEGLVDSVCRYLFSERS